MLKKPTPSVTFTSNKSEERRQDYCDKRREPEYTNKVSINSWLRGGGKEQAMGKPGFDKSK